VLFQVGLEQRIKAVKQVEAIDRHIKMETAFQTHLISKTKLLAAARQNATQRARKTLADHSCDFEKWLNGEGELRYGKFAEFQKVIDAHRYYRFVVESVADLSEGKVSTIFYSELLSNTAFTTSSFEIGKAIRELKDAAESARP
jgi:hypothetical protein